MEQRYLHKSRFSPALRPHRARPGGAEVCGQGVRVGPLPALVQNPPLHRGEPGGGDQREALLVHKPLLHRDMPGGAVCVRSFKPAGGQGWASSIAHPIEPLGAEPISKCDQHPCTVYSSTMSARRQTAMISLRTTTTRRRFRLMPVAFDSAT